DYNIGANARLLLDGPNVEVHITADNGGTSRTPSDWSTFSHGGPAGIRNSIGQQSLTLYGNLQVNDGFLWTGRNAGILFRDDAPGVIEVNGGELNAVQISLSNAASAGIYTFSLNGGIIRLTDYRGGARNGESILHLANPDVVFNMTGGQLIVEGLSGNADTDGILINAAPGNINVTGGTVRTDFAGTVEINSTAPFYNFVIETHTVDMQSTLRVLNDLTIRTGTTRGTAPNEYGGYLDLCPDGTNCFNLEVGRNLTIEDSGVLDVWAWDGSDNDNSATVTFNGTSDGTFYVGDITTYTNALVQFSDPDDTGRTNTFNGRDGTIIYWELPLYDWIINKPGATLFLSSKNPGKGQIPGSNAANYINASTGGKNVTRQGSNLIKVTNRMELLSGTLNQVDPDNTVGWINSDGDNTNNEASDNEFGQVGDAVAYSVRLAGTNVTNNGTFFVYEDGVTPKEGILVLRKNAGDVTLNTSDGASFGNFRLLIAPNIVSITSDLNVGRLEVTDGVMDIGTHHLRVDVLEMRLAGDAPSVSGGQRVFDASNYIRMAGNASDGGLSVRVPRSVSTIPNVDEFENLHTTALQNDNREYNQSNIIWFPIGTNVSGTDKYTPAVCYLLNNGTTSGDEYINVRVVDGELQTTDLSGGDILSYYWNVDFEGYASGEEPTVSWLFQYDDGDLDIGGGAEANFVPGKVLDGGTYTRSDEGGVAAVKHGGVATIEGDILGNDPRNIIIFNGVGTSSSTVTDDDIDTATPAVYNNASINTQWSSAWPNTGFTLERANYTAGEAARFVGAPTVFRTRQNIANATGGWNQNGIWQRDDNGDGNFQNAPNGVYPATGDVAIIRFGTEITVDNAAVAAAQVIIDGSRGTGIPGNGRSKLVFTVPDGAGYNSEFGRISAIAGGDNPNRGTLEFYVDNDWAGNLPEADYGEYVNYQNPNGTYFEWTYNFFKQGATVGDPPADGVVVMPANITTYPQLRFQLSTGSDLFNSNGATANGPKVIQFPNAAVTVRDQTRLQDGIIVRLSDGADASVTINGRLRFDSNGENSRLQFPGNTTNQQVLRVRGNIEFESGGTKVIEAFPSGSTVEHKLIAEGDIVFDDGGSLDLNEDADAKITLEFGGDGGSNRMYASSGSPATTPSFFKIIMNKGSNTTPTFTFEEDFNIQDASSTFQPIEILNGTLVLNSTYNGGAGILLASGSNFLLPNTANASASSGSGGLEIRQGTVRIEGDDTGIILDGLLRVSGGILDMDDAANDGNNFIQYSASGNALMEVSAGTVDVGSHIRRSTSNTSGVLRYRQTDGTVNIGTQAAPLENRALFEVLNAGSEFTLTGGDFNILRQNGSNPSIATLQLDPDTYDLTGSTINIGGTATPASQTITINSTIPLNNLSVNANNSPVARIRGRALNIDGTLTINSGATLDADGWALNMGGDFVNDGTFTANGNTTTFSGSAAQQISGATTGGTTFFNLAKNGSNTLSLSSHNLTVEGNLEVLQGTLDDGGNTITLLGNMLHQGTHTSPSGAGQGIVFAGSSRQELRGLTNSDMQLGKITINNGAGVVIPDGNGYNFTINEALRLSAGVLDIGGSLLTLTTNAALEEVSTFGPNNMVQTNSSFTDNGFRRNFNTISTATSLMFPVGQTYYTPVRFNIDGSSAGSLTVRPANERHPSIIEDLEAPDPEIVDSLNVLQYHWIVSASGISGFTGDAVMTYNQTTVEGNEADYIPARLYNNSTSWDKSLPATNVDEGANTIRFDWDIAVNDNEITGDYTAGVPNAIPDEVPVYITDGTGDYTAGATWTKPVGASYPDVTDGIGPIGAIIIVESGHTLTFNENNLRVYRTEIRGGGTLNVAGTFGHRLGDVSGTGTLRISSDGSSGVLPAGFYTNFLSCSGGGLEYAGTGSYDVLGGITSLRNLTLSGTGSRNLPANSITICNNLALNGPTLDNTNNVNITVQNSFVQDNGIFNAGSGSLTITNALDINGGTFNGGTGNKTISGALDLASGTLNVGSNGTFTVRRNVNYTSGTFNSGSGSAVFTLGGSTAQTVNGTFTGGASFHRLRINNAAGVSFTGDVEVDQELDLSNGIVSTNGNNFTLTQAATTVAGGGSSAYINGQLRKVMASGNSFRFPIGKSNRFAPVQVNNVSSGSALTWQAEYFGGNAQTQGVVGNLDPALAGVATISTLEYWRISDNQPSGSATATIGLSWNAGSDVSQTASGLDDLRVMRWDDAASNWVNEGGTDHGTSPAFGELLSDETVSFSEQIFTLGSTTMNNPLPVELVSFTVKMQGDEALLAWKTASERNNDFFEIQRSINGQDWTSLGFVEGAGDSSEPLSYAFTDEQPLYGVSYYRLRQVDFDGAFEYSAVISLENVRDELSLPDPQMLLFPNPASLEEVAVRVLHLKYGQPVELKLSDAYGKTHLAVQLSAESLEEGIKLPVSKPLPAGIYVVSIKQGETSLQQKLLLRK
ncbi:MAG: hypothetical protein ACLFT3_12890, partial [Cyclobacteriaceae bacterium]